MLKINGADLMQELSLEPGPKIGLLLNSLLAEALDEPALNERETLIERARELATKTPEELTRALERIRKALDADEQERMKKYYV